MISKFIALLAAITTIAMAEKLFSNEKTALYIKKLILPSPPQRKSLGSLTKDTLSLFDLIFGPKHFAWRCARWSSFFSIIFSVIAFSLIGVFFNFADLIEMSDVIFTKQNYPFIILSLFATIIIDYLSLWETRFVISWINEETHFLKIIMILIIDALASFFIFVVLFSVFKTLTDILFIPKHYDFSRLFINQGIFDTIELNSSTNFIYNFFLYYFSVAKYTFYSTLSVIQDALSFYWFSSLYIEGKKIYVLPGSTMWLTTHLSSIYIYAGIFLWIVGRVGAVLNLHNHINMIKKLFILSHYNLDSNTYPITIVIMNLAVYYYFFSFIIFVYMKI